MSLQVQRGLDHLDGVLQLGGQERTLSPAGEHRSAVIPPGLLVGELHRHQDRVSERDADTLVFTSASGAPLERSNFRYRVWVPATQEVGLAGLRSHDLRHTAGTLTARTGATAKEIMARLGHAGPRAAMVYQHATEDRDRLIAGRLTAMATEVGLVMTPPATAGQGPARKGATESSGTDRARRPGPSPAG